MTGRGTSGTEPITCLAHAEQIAGRSTSSSEPYTAIPEGSS